MADLDVVKPRQVDILPLRPLIIDGSSLVFSVEQLEFHDFHVVSMIFSMIFPCFFLCFSHDFFGKFERLLRKMTPGNAF